MSEFKVRANIEPLYVDDSHRRKGKVHVSEEMAKKILSREVDALGAAKSLGINVDQKEINALAEILAALKSGAFTADPGVIKAFEKIVTDGPDRSWLERARDAQSYKFGPSALLGVVLDSFVTSNPKPD